MASILKTVFGSPQSPSAMGAKTPSMSDFSMGAHEDATEEFQREHPEAPTSPVSPSGRRKSGDRSRAWADTFNPGRNYHNNYKAVGNDYFDHVDKKPGNNSIWDHIIKSERQKAFSSFDRDNDGFVTADDLRMKLGAQADVAQLIAAADRNGDGKIDYSEFCELIKNS